MSNLITLEFTVNGRKITDTVDGDLTLLAYLRRSLKLTGAKEGCGEGHCGACTVLLNGKPVKSCVVKLKSGRLKGSVIETIEGLRSADGSLHPIQQAFADIGALQCGFCTPGVIMTVKGLLDENPAPSREEIQAYIGPRNLCRCTGYQKIFEAAETAAKRITGGKDQDEEATGYKDDASVRMIEAAGKVTGRLKYADDIEWEGALYGKILFAGLPHARLSGLETGKALSLPGVAGAITAEDIPGSRRIGMVERDQPALVGLGDEIRSVADPIAAVFAETPEAAAAALDAVHADYGELPGVYTVEDACRAEATLVWKEKPGNIFYRGTIERGNPHDAMKQADIVVSDTFSTSRAAHGFMEPESGMARPDGKGGVEIHYPTQSVFDDQIQVSEVLGLPREKVRVVQLSTGGAFGGKEDVIFHHILALAALKFDRPVKITLTRRESLRVTQKKHPTRYKASLGLSKEGRFLSLIMDITADKGAYAALGFDIMENMMAFAGGPYFIPDVSINGCSVYTHNVMSGAMRGFGANQSNFVIESLVDMASRETGIDPVKIRLMNALRPGLPTVTDHVLEPGVPGVMEILEAAEEALKKESPPAIPAGFKPGFGIACGVKNVGFGHNLPESAGARAELREDGTCHLYVTHHEYGQGAAIGQARIASEALGIPLEKVVIHGPDTANTPYTGASTASRQTFISGNATLGACRELYSKLMEQASKVLGALEPADLSLDGDSIAVKTGGRRVSLRELGGAFSAEFRSFPPKTDGFLEKGKKSAYGNEEFTSRRTYFAYAYGLQAAWVAVEPETGKVKVLKVLTVGDVGRVLNRRAVEGQQQGGVVMGIGYALSETFKTDKGQNLTRTLKDYGLIRADEVPDIMTLAVEVPHPWGPLGVKGLAEAPSLATAPAIANAIYDAVGVRYKDLPITVEMIKGDF